MQEHISHIDYIHSLKLKAVELSKAMLSGQLSFLEGALAIPNPLEPGENPECENAFKAFSLIRSETDSLPIIDRNYWSKEALQSNEHEIIAAEAWAMNVGSEACNVIIRCLSS